MQRQTKDAFLGKDSASPALCCPVRWGGWKQSKGTEVLCHSLQPLPALTRLWLVLFAWGWASLLRLFLWWSLSIKLKLYWRSSWSLPKGKKWHNMVRPRQLQYFKAIVSSWAFLLSFFLSLLKQWCVHLGDKEKSPVSIQFGWSPPDHSRWVLSGTRRLLHTILHCVGSSQISPAHLRVKTMAPRPSSVPSAANPVLSFFTKFHGTYDSSLQTRNQKRLPWVNPAASARPPGRRECPGRRETTRNKLLSVHSSPTDALNCALAKCWRRWRKLQSNSV